jgi:hypothetical protein
VGDKREQFNNVDLALDKSATQGPLSDILA